MTSLAAELGVTPRTIRFYEDKGLVTPRRAGVTRVYTARDRARMVLIMRGKRLGFSLRDIGEFLDLYDADPRQLAQMRQLRGAVRARIDELEQQLVALDLTLGELREIERQAVVVLDDDRPRKPRRRAVVAAPEETIR